MSAINKVIHFFAPANKRTMGVSMHSLVRRRPLDGVAGDQFYHGMRLRPAGHDLFRDLWQGPGNWRTVGN
jgi:hypothetical protein